MLVLCVSVYVLGHRIRQVETRADLSHGSLSLLTNTTSRDAMEVETLSSNLQDQFAILCKQLLNDGGRCHERGADV